MEPNDPQYGNTPHNQRKLMEDYAINALLAHLSQLFLIPLPKSQEVRAFLPLSYLPLLAQRLITASASAIRVSSEMTLTCLLGSIFAAARGNFQIQVSEHHCEVATAHIVASADSGQRKSAAVDIYRSPLAEYQAERQEQHATMGILGEQKILQAAAKKAEEDIPEIGYEDRLRRYGNGRITKRVRHDRTTSSFGPKTVCVTPISGRYAHPGSACLRIGSARRSSCHP